MVVSNSYGQKTKYRITLELDVLDELKRSLLEKAFNGEL